jgi:hypothetical protein
MLTYSKSGSGFGMKLFCPLGVECIVAKSLLRELLINGKI